MNYLDNYRQWLEDPDATPELKRELTEMGRDDNLLREAFTMPLSFGTAGMRGILSLGINRMNVYTVSRATLGLAKFVIGAKMQNRGVLIGYDTRNHSFEFASTVAKVLEYNGVNAYLYEDVRPVPMISFGVRELNCFAGVMITASHNPKEYNGYKVYGEDGAQLSLTASDKLSSIINSIDDYIGIKQSDTVITTAIRGLNGVKISDHVTVVGKDLDEKFYSAILPIRVSEDAVRKVKDFKIVYTPLHGTGFVPVTHMFDLMGVEYEVVKEQTTPDGNFPTVVTPNPENPEALTLAIRLADEIGAEVVIGTDPDCDRMGVAIRADGEMKVLSGNQIGVLMENYVLFRRKQTDRMPANPVTVKSIVTSSLARKVSESYNVPSVDVLTGFKFFGEKIKEWESTHEYNYVFGFEESFGFLAGTHARDKDAVSASMLFAELVCYYKSIGKTLYEVLQEIYAELGYYYDYSTSVMYPGLDGMAKMKRIMDGLRADSPKILGGLPVIYFSDFESGYKVFSDGSREKLPQAKSNVVYFGFANGDWACARPSGTEPKLKYYISVHDNTAEKAEAKGRAVAEELKALLDR